MAPRKLTDDERVFLMAIDFDQVDWRVVWTEDADVSRRHYIPWIGWRCYRTQHMHMERLGYYAMKHHGWPYDDVKAKLTSEGREALGRL